MPWHNVNVRRRYGASLAVAVFSLLLSVVIHLPVQAVDTGVSAVICGSGAPGASIEITQPNDDSILNQTTTTFRGNISNTTQIEIEVDGQYVGTVAVGSNQATFSTDITLTEGTHTVKFTANDVCQVANASAELVVTYQPVSEPSDGGSTPTELDDGAVIGPISQGEQPTTPLPQQINQLPVIGPAASAVADFIQSIGLAATVEGQNAFVGAARILLTIVSTSTVVLAGLIAPIVLQAVPGLSNLLSSSAPRSRIYTSWLLRVGAILTMGVVYFL